LEKLYKFDFIIDSQTQLTKAINILKQEKERAQHLPGEGK